MYTCKIVLTILLLELQLYFVNYDPVFRSYDHIFHDKIVPSMQHTLCNRPTNFILKKIEIHQTNASKDDTLVLLYEYAATNGFLIIP